MTTRNTEYFNIQSRAAARNIGNAFEKFRTFYTKTAVISNKIRHTIIIGM